MMLKLCGTGLSKLLSWINIKTRGWQKKDVNSRHSTVTVEHRQPYLLIAPEKIEVCLGGVKLCCSGFSQTKVGDRAREFQAQEYARILI